jgi:hypothetical protein
MGEKQSTIFTVKLLMDFDVHVYTSFDFLVHCCFVIIVGFSSILKNELFHRIKRHTLRLRKMSTSNTNSKKPSSALVDEKSYCIGITKLMPNEEPQCRGIKVVIQKAANTTSKTHPNDPHHPHNPQHPHNQHHHVTDVPKDESHGTVTAKPIPRPMPNLNNNNRGVISPDGSQKSIMESLSTSVVRHVAGMKKVVVDLSNPQILKKIGSQYVHVVSSIPSSAHMLMNRVVDKFSKSDSSSK